MISIWKQLSLLLGGVLIGAIIKSFIPLLPWIGIILLFLLAVFLILWGADVISKGSHYVKLRTRKKGKSPKVGILNVGWGSKDKFSAWTDISPRQWKKELEKQAKKNKVKVRIELVDVKKNFDSYIAILNPYGGAYPESDIKNFETLKKIFDYVKEEGLFINVADIPGYFAYSLLRHRRLDATPPTYGIDRGPKGEIQISEIRPFSLTPFMERLGLRVHKVEIKNNVPHELDVKCNPKFKDKANEIKENMHKIKVHRVVEVKEGNVEPIMTAELPDPTGEKVTVTPFFYAIYGDGRFLISLVPLRDEYPQTRKMTKILARIVVTSIRLPS